MQNQTYTCMTAGSEAYDQIVIAEVMKMLMKAKNWNV